MKVLIFLVKTYSNWCATLNSRVPLKEDRNTIDDIVDKNYNDKAGQLAWAGSGSQLWRRSASNWATHNYTRVRLCVSKVEILLLCAALYQRRAVTVTRERINCITERILSFLLRIMCPQKWRFRWNEERFFGIFLKEKLNCIHSTLQSKLRAWNSKNFDV